MVVPVERAAATTRAKADSCLSRERHDQQDADRLRRSSSGRELRCVGTLVAQTDEQHGGRTEHDLDGREDGDQTHDE